MHLSLPSKDHLLYNKLFIFATEYIHRALQDGNGRFSQNCFSFSRFVNLSPMEMSKVFVIGILFRYIPFRTTDITTVYRHNITCYALHRLCLATIMERRIKMIRYWEDWNADERTEIPRNQMLILPRKIDSSSRSLRGLIFTRRTVEGESVYTHTTHVIHSMPETVAHRILRSSKKTANQSLKVTNFHQSYLLQPKNRIFDTRLFPFAESASIQRRTRRYKGDFAARASSSSKTAYSTTLSTDYHSILYLRYLF